MPIRGRYNPFNLAAFNQKLDHTLLLNIGTNTHAQIDTHLALVNEHIDWTAATANFLTTGNVTIGSATANAGVFSMIQGGVASDPTFTITQSGNNVTINQTVGDMTITAGGGDISFGDENLTTTGQINLGSVGANIITATNANGDLRLGAGGGTNDLKIDTNGNVDIFENLTVAKNLTTTGAMLGGGSGHDQFSDFVANEHINWTAGVNKLFNSAPATSAGTGSKIGMQVSSSDSSMSPTGTPRVAIRGLYTKTGDDSTFPGAVDFYGGYFKMTYNSVDADDEGNFQYFGVYGEATDIGTLHDIGITHDYFGVYGKVTLSPQDEDIDTLIGIGVYGNATGNAKCVQKCIGIYGTASGGDTNFAGIFEGITLLGDGGTTNYVDISATGDVVFVGSAGLPFGEIYARDNTATTSTSTTKTQILIFDTDGQSNNMTSVNAQGHIVVVKAGKYKIDTSISIKNSSGAAHVINVEMYKNNGATVFNNIHAGRNLGTGSDVGNLTMSGLVDLAVDDTIEIWITSDSASARNVTVEDIDFSAIQTGGT